jgi:hypothetical protein
MVIQPVFADRGGGRGNMDRHQERYEDEKPTLYDLNQGEFEDDEPNWNRVDNEHSENGSGSCSDGSCRVHRRLVIEDD